MSYILDALKKADAQRERDPARGIHAQPGGVLAGSRQGAGDRSWFWGASALAVVGIAAAGWAMYQDRAKVEMPVQPRTELAARPAATVAAPVEVPAAAPAATPLTDTAVPPASPVASVASVVLPPPAAVRVEPGADARTTSQSTPRARPQSGPGTPAAAAPAATPAAAPAAAAPAVVAAPAAPAGNTAADSPKAATPAAVARPVAPAVPPITSGPLPPDAPKLAFSGAVYSSNPAQRMLIVNGQVVHEGADLGAGVVLEEIKPKTAVVRFRGARYQVGL
jgi:general secretion pathway protein B